MKHGKYKFHWNPNLLFTDRLTFSARLKVCSYQREFKNYFVFRSISFFLTSECSQEVVKKRKLPKNISEEYLEPKKKSILTRRVPVSRKKITFLNIFSFPLPFLCLFKLYLKKVLTFFYYYKHLKRNCFLERKKKENLIYWKPKNLRLRLIHTNNIRKTFQSLFFAIFI